MADKKIKSIRNLRDLGGMATTDGKAVKSKCFLRGGKLDKITKSDAEILKHFWNVSDVIDLRTETERKEKPDRLIDGIQYHHMPVFDESTAGITHEQNTDTSDIYSLLPDMNELYRNMVSENCISHLSEIFNFLMNRDSDDGAVLFHCTEGKDRTGIISMILLSLFGVSEETIMKDYLLTNAVSRKKANIYYYMILLWKHNRNMAVRIRDVFSAKEEYLISAMDAVRKEWGSMENFVIQGMHINPEKLTQFVQNFTD